MGDGLAVRIRQNTRSMRAPTYQSITSNIAEPNAALIENPRLPTLWQPVRPTRLLKHRHERFISKQRMKFRI